MVPNHERLKMGKSVNFSCFANEKLDWQWLLNDGALTANAEVVLPYSSLYSHLKIDSVTLDDVGTYKCMGYSSNGAQKYVADGELLVKGEEIQYFEVLINL